MSDWGCQISSDSPLLIGFTAESQSCAAAIHDAARAFGYPVNITTVQFPELIDGDYAKPLVPYDAILSPGGHDIDPRYFTAEVGPEMKSRLEEEHRMFGNGGDGSLDWMNPLYAARDDQEFKFMTAYFREPSFSRLPLLGICYGMQMMAAVQGIPMYVDITHDLSLSPRRNTDSISFMSDRAGPLCAVLGPQTFQAVKNHHQSVNLKFIEEHPELYPGVSIDATSSQGKILEILSFKDRPAVGIQFHAETSSPRVSAAVFGWFLNRAWENRSSRLALKS